MVNIPPMKIDPKGPAACPSWDPISRELRTRPMSGMSPMPVAPIGMYPGMTSFNLRSTPDWSTPVMIGRSWPIWFIV
jgi:hypothetical protein